jgi:putative hydrolase of the HAD superfamily
MAIEALLFDLGKVLVDYDFELAMRRFVARSPLPRDVFERVILDKNWIWQYETGAITTEGFHRYLREKGELEMTLEEFHDTWTGVFLPELIVPEKLLASLKSRYPLLLVSNINEVHASYVARSYRVFEYFDHRILSHEVGSMKPERKIYDVAIAASGKSPDALFFTDDRIENVQSAQALGIQAHHFRSLNDLVTSLKECGVDMNGF